MNDHKVTIDEAIDHAGGIDGVRAVLDWAAERLSENELNEVIARLEHPAFGPNQLWLLIDRFKGEQEQKV
jgi:hypothetical protein